MEEDLEYWLEPDLLTAISFYVRKSADKLKRLSELADRIAALREAMAPKPIPKPEGEHYAYAVDSSYGSPPLELVGGVFTVIAYGYVGKTKRGVDKHLSGVVYFEDREEQDVSRYATLLERKLAAKLLRQKAEGKKEFDILIVDGEIAVHPLPFNLAVSGGRYEEVNKVVDSLMEGVERSQVALVGLAKRVRSRYLSLLYGDCLPVNDRVAASLILRPGEYAVLGPLRDVLPKWAEIHYASCEGGPLKDDVLSCFKEGVPARNAKSERLCQRLREFGVNFGNVLNSNRYPHLKLLGDIVIAYYMPPGSQTAVRVEVLNSGDYSVEEVVSYLSATSSTTTGYPQILDEVDRYVRVTPDLVDAVLMMLIREAPSKLLNVLQPNNLQKFRRLF